MKYVYQYDDKMVTIEAANDEEAFQQLLPSIRDNFPERMIVTAGDGQPQMMTRAQHPFPIMGGILGYVVKHMCEAENFQDFHKAYEVMRSMEEPRMWAFTKDWFDAFPGVKERMKHQFNKYKSQLPSQQNPLEKD